MSLPFDLVEVQSRNPSTGESLTFGSRTSLPQSDLDTEMLDSKDDDEVIEKGSLDFMDLFLSFL